MLCGVTCRAACMFSTAGGVPRLLSLSAAEMQAAKPRVWDQVTVSVKRLSSPCLEIVPFPCACCQLLVSPSTLGGTLGPLCREDLLAAIPGALKDRTLLDRVPRLPPHQGSTQVGGRSEEPSVVPGQRDALWWQQVTEPPVPARGITCEYGERVPRDWRRQEAK